MSEDVRYKLKNSLEKKGNNQNCTKIKDGRQKAGVQLSPPHNKKSGEQKDGNQEAGPDLSDPQTEPSCEAEYDDTKSSPPDDLELENDDNTHRQDNDDNSRMRQDGDDNEDEDKIRRKKETKTPTPAQRNEQRAPDQAKNYITTNIKHSTPRKQPTGAREDSKSTPKRKTRSPEMMKLEQGGSKRIRTLDSWTTPSTKKGTGTHDRQKAPKPQDSVGTSARGSKQIQLGLNKQLGITKLKPITNSSTKTKPKAQRTKREKLEYCPPITKYLIGRDELNRGRESCGPEQLQVRQEPRHIESEEDSGPGDPPTKREDPGE